MTEPQTITEFIEERLAEDEAAAREAIEERRRVSQDGERPDYYLMAWPDTGRPAVLVGGERVLREVEAKRAILNEHAPQFTVQVGAPVTLSCGACGNWDEYPVSYPCSTLLALAAIWNDHPGWREEWGRCPDWCEEWGRENVAGLARGPENHPDSREERKP